MNFVLPLKGIYQNLEGTMKFGSDNDSSYESCSKHINHCCKCYDISEIFSSDTKRTTSLSKQSLDCVQTQFSTRMSYNQDSWSQQEQPSASSSGCESASELTSSCVNRKRVKWTIDLHDKFVECVNHLGGPMKATPKGILKLMRTHELTIYHVKSHLQKYRSLKHVQDAIQGTKFKEEENLPEDSKINELMRLQDEVGQHLQEQLEMQRELFLMVEDQNKQLHEMIKYQKRKKL